MKIFRTTLVTFFLGLSFLANAQTPNDQAAVTMRARAWMDTLTSPAFHGRGYVNNGDRTASDWLAKQFARIGLAPVKKDYFQPFQFNVNSFPDSIKVSIDGKRLAPGIDFLVDPASGKADGAFEMVHVSPSDLATPERKSMTMGVISGKATCVHWPATTKLSLIHISEPPRPY